MNPYLKYKQVSSLSWTRVDMLLVVYDQAVSNLDAGMRLLEENRTSDLAPVRLKAMRALLAVVDGLDLKQGELPNQVLRLVEFCLEQINSETPDAWRSAAEVMNKLREGFREIQEQARKDEYEGRIPALDVVG
jgi:flagellar protein FliS